MEQKKKAATASNTPEEIINFSELLSLSLKHWKWFIVSVFICFTIAFIYVKVTPNTYQLLANILIKTDEKKGSSGLASKMGALSGALGGMSGLSMTDNIEDEVRFMTSHTFTKNMIMSLGLHTDYKLEGFFTDDDLYNNSPVIAEVDKGILDTLTANLSFKVIVKKDRITIKTRINKDELEPVHVKSFPYTLHTDYGDVLFKCSEHPTKKLPYTLLISISGADFAAESFQKSIGIGAASKKSNIIGLSIQDKIIPRGKQILNTLIEMYNEDALDDKNKSALKTKDFIGERLALLVDDLNLIEKSVENYKSDNQLVDVKAEAELYLKKMTEMKQHSLWLDVQLQLIKMVEEQVKNPANQYQMLPGGLGVPKEMADNIQSYNALVLQRINYLRDMSPTNPAILSLNEQLNLMQQNIVSSIENVKQDYLKNKESWSKEGREVQSRIQRMPRQEREFIDIQRQQKVKTELYLFLLERDEENELTLASTTPKAKIIDEAFSVWKPVWPRRLTLLAASILIGLFLPIVFFILKGFLTFKIEDKNQLEKLTSVPVLGEVCKAKDKGPVVVKDGVTSSIAELFRLIRTNIRFILTKPEEKVITVTSSISGEGKTFFVINFSMSLSLMKDKKIVMVGLDIRSPRLAEYLSIPPSASKGITTFMSSETLKPDEVIVPSGLHPNLFLIPAGPIPPNPSELLLSNRLDEMFAYLRDNFDYIVVDSAPAGMVSDTFTLDRVSDATIYLCRAYYTQKSHLKFVENVVANERLKKLSLVINGTTSKTGYGYGYGGVGKLKKDN